MKFPSVYEMHIVVTVSARAHY